MSSCTIDRLHILIGYIYWSTITTTTQRVPQSKKSVNYQENKRLLQDEHAFLTIKKKLFTFSYSIKGYYILHILTEAL